MQITVTASVSGGNDDSVELLVVPCEEEEISSLDILSVEGITLSAEDVRTLKN